MRNYTNLFKITRYHELVMDSFIIGKTIFIVLVIKEQSKIVYLTELTFFFQISTEINHLVLWLETMDDIYHNTIIDFIHHYDLVILILNK